ncbi:unnamed protein product [Diamesa tonsa]
MAKIISQETYDDVIKENIIEFSMSVDEARKETIEQFQAQGINLINIIKDLTINETSGKPLLNELIDSLREHAEKTKVLEEKELENCLDSLIAELIKTIAHRVYASKLNTMDSVVTLIDVEISKENNAENSILHKLILCAHALTHNNPDIFDGKSLDVVLRLLDTQKNEHIVSDTLKWIQKACLLHENNRQMIVNEDILIKHLKPLLSRTESSVIKSVSTVFRFLILDDDIRVEFGKAHEHARLIGQECLGELTLLLTTFKDDCDLLADLMLTIAALTVRNEFCQVIADNGGLTRILDAMVEFPDSIKIARESFKLIKALAGNDGVKVKIIQHGVAPIVESSLNRFKDDESIAKNALLCISTLALRLKETSTALFETGVAETIIQTMKIHENNQVIQRNGAWAIRNMVSRSREQCETWLSLGAEDVLNTALKNHPSISQDTRSALRDLGAKVQLIEEWKGTAEKMINDF